ncbi:MAG TPA: DegT/DnrJ/EryC1/StrS family aminotransferase, partial [Isosphaeraceae bacterium]
MIIPLVDLKAQYRSIKPEVDAAVAGVMERCDFILGPAVGEFEREFARFVGAEHCVSVASGTDALWMAMQALGIGPGDKVLIPANTFIATALAVSDAGATPVLVDMDPATYNIDVDAARKALVPGVKAIVPVHLYGQPADMRGVLDLAREQGLIVIEDAAQAHGAVPEDGRCGTMGVASGFSFYPGKNLGAYGDGGAVCTSDGALAERMRKLRNWGGTVKYHHPERGFNSRLDTIQAAVLGVKLRHLADWNRRRRQVAAWYREALAPMQDRVELPAEAPGTVEHVYHLYVLRLRKGDRDAVLRRLNERGVGAGIHYPIPVHLQGAYADLGLGPGSFPEAEAAAKSILSLPIYAELTREQVDVVAAAL